jgi:hypothetical protein
LHTNPPIGHASRVGDPARKQATEQAKILRGLAERIEHGAPELPPELAAELARALDARDLDAIEPVDGAAVVRWLETGEGDPWANAGR